MESTIASKGSIMVSSTDGFSTTGGVKIDKTGVGAAFGSSCIVLNLVFWGSCDEIGASDALVACILLL